MALKNDMRQYSRTKVLLRGAVRMESGIYLEGEVKNISLNGLWFSMERSLPMGHSVQMNLVLHESGKPQHISMLGYVSRIGDDGVAISFSDLDAMNMGRLKTLMQ